MGPVIPSAAARSDAARNRERIVAAARACFAEAEPDRTAEVSMASIARRAGVGMATLYRNFAGRRELLEALYAAEVDVVCAAAGSAGPTDEAPTDAGLDPGLDAGDRLRAWLRQLFDFFTGKHPIAVELLAQTGPDDPVFGGSRARVRAAGETLLIAAQRSGRARTDLDVDQLLDLAHAVAGIGGPPEHVRAIQATVLDGLRPPDR